MLWLDPAGEIVDTVPTGPNRVENSLKRKGPHERTSATRRIPVYDILEEAGLTVFLVNARETKNLPGKKTDVQESPAWRV